MTYRIYDKNIEDCYQRMHMIIDKMNMLFVAIKVLQGNLEQELKELEFLMEVKK